MRALRRLALVVLLGSLACRSSEPPPAESAAEPPFLVPVARGVYAALQPPDRRFDDANVVVVEGSDGLLLVDAPADTEFVRKVAAEVKARFTKPVRFVVNTHWHADHTQGNAIYLDELGPALEIVGHESLIRDVPDRAERDLRERVARLDQRIPEAERQLASGKDDDGTDITDDERAKQQAAIDRARRWLERNRDARFVVPNHPYADETITLSLGDRDVVLRHVRAHTRGDTVLFLPDERVLITGDVLDDLPFVGHGYPREWVAVLRDLATLGAETIVPGHGPVFHGSEQLRDVSGYLEDLVAQVGKASVAGLSAEDTRASVDLSAWRATLAGEDPAAQRFFDGTVEAAIDRAWAEARGTAD